MMPSRIWNIMAHVRCEYGIVSIGYGGWAHVAPVEEELVDFENALIGNPFV